MASRILAINDDQAILDLYNIVLKEEGYEVSLSVMEIENAKEVEHLHPDLVILDLKMGMHNTGMLLLQQLRMYRPTKDIPVIICTAAMHEIREQADMLEQKGVAVIYKPFDLDELLETVRKKLS